MSKRHDIKNLPTKNAECLKNLVASSSVQVSLVVNPITKTIAHLQGLFKITKAKSSRSAATEFLKRYALSFNLPPDLSGFTISESEGPEKSRVFHFEQRIDHLPVFRSGVVVQTTNAGDVVGVCAHTSSVTGVNITPKVTMQQAGAVALCSSGIEKKIEMPGTLGVFDRNLILSEKDDPHLAWQFIIKGTDGEQYVYVDAVNGAILLNHSLPKVVVSSGVSCPNVGPLPQYHINPSTGVPDFMTFGPSGLWIPESASGSPEDVALGFFNRFTTVFGAFDSGNQLTVVSTQQDSSSPNMTHVLLQQICSGIPVFGANIRVHLTPAMTISSISGNYTIDPIENLFPYVWEDLALLTAKNFVNSIIPELGESSIFNLLFGSSNNYPIQQKGLIILPAALCKISRPSNPLCYYFRFLNADVFVSATTSEIILAIPNYFSIDRLVFDALGQSELSFPPLVENDGINVSSLPLNADAIAADPLITKTLAFYAGLGWDSYDNKGSNVEVVTDSSLALAGGCPNSHWDPIRNQMWYCTGMVVPDVFAHEFTHGVTQSTAGLVELDESGALNEHYSDVMGELAFPNANPHSWLIGQGSTAGVIRDLKNPVVSTYSQYVPRGPGCTGILDPLTNGSCDFGNVHTNCGIGNRAAVLLCDGDGSTAHPGIGRQKLALLYFLTLTTRMHPYSTYLDELHNTWQTAIDLVNSTLGNLGLDFTGVSDQVSWAFTQVGIDPRLTAGWFSIGGGLTGGKGTITFYKGQVALGGATITDEILIVRALTSDTGIPFWEGQAMASSGGSVVGPGGLFGASIVSSGVGTSQEETVIRFFESGFFPMQIQVYLQLSTPPSGLPVQTEAVTQTISHWASVPGFGGKGDETINAGKTLSGTGCIITQVVLELLDSKGNVVATTTKGSPDATQHFGLFNAFVYGASITSDGTGTNMEDVTVHWYFDVGSACRYRLHYYIQGTSCSL